MVHFDFMDPPAPAALGKGLTELLHLGFISEDGAITRDGLLADELPVAPRMAVAILASRRLRCTREIRSIAAFLEQGARFKRGGTPELREEALEARQRFLTPSATTSPP